MDDYLFRPFDTRDSVEDLTVLLHQAYAAHAAAGRTFFASYQTVDDTRRRIAKGECWVTTQKGVVVGTVTLTARFLAPEGYPAPTGCGSFNQLAVLPAYAGTGLGSQLLTLAERRIHELGARQIIIDTSALAVELIRWYERRGYVRTGMWKWNVTNYDSVVLSKDVSEVTSTIRASQTFRNEPRRK